MLNWGGLISTSARLASTEAGSFFFHPVQLHLDPTDLLVELGLQRLVVLGRRLASLAEEAFATGQGLLLPAVDQGGVDAVLAGPLVHRAVLAERRQGPLGLERRRVGLPFAHHRFPFPGLPTSSLIGCPVFGVHYSPSNSRSWAARLSHRRSVCGRRANSHWTRMKS